MIQILWLKQNFLEKNSHTSVLATCYSSIQSYVKIDAIWTILFQVHFLYLKSWTFWLTDKELLIAGQEYKYSVHIFNICSLQIGS